MWKGNFSLETLFRNIALNQYLTTVSSKIKCKEMIVLLITAYENPRLEDLQTRISIIKVLRSLAGSREDS